MPMFNGERSHGNAAMKNIAKTINFDDELDFDDAAAVGGQVRRVGEGTRDTRDIRNTSSFDDCPSTGLDIKTPSSPVVDSHQSSPMWGSLVATPLPGSSPFKRSKPPSRKLGLSPIPFSPEKQTDEMLKKSYSPLNESGIGMLPTTPVEDRMLSRLCTRVAGPNGTPLRTPSLQQSLRRMKLNDGSRSPLRCQKTFSARCQKFKAITSNASFGDIINRPILDGSNGLTPVSAPLSDEPQTNVNPFASNKESIRKNGLKRLREEYDWSYEDFTTLECVDEDERPRKKLALRQFNTSRLKEEFHVVCSIGDGQFGSVYKCVNRLDGCTYAIKKSKVPVAGSVFERNALNEVYAHAVLAKHIHIVGYYSAWAEHDHMFIQNEYCRGGSLSESLHSNRKLGKAFTELELKHLLCQLVHGLKYIHSYDLAHLDLKPDNIFISVDGNRSDLHDSLCGDIGDDALSLITYKIGDFGMVTPVGSPTVNEGDCRYLPIEILQDDYSHLLKADIFSLAMTIFESGSGLEMPLNGPQWHAFREIGLPSLPNVSMEFNNLLRLMANRDPTIRPSAAELSHSHVLVPFIKQTDNELRKELEEQKMKNEQLLRQLDQMKTVLQSGICQQTKKRRLVGRLTCRTQSSF